MNNIDVTKAFLMTPNGTVVQILGNDGEWDEAATHAQYDEVIQKEIAMPVAVATKTV